MLFAVAWGAASGEARGVLLFGGGMLWVLTIVVGYAVERRVHRR
jgi:hypothetical protein